MNETTNCVHTHMCTQQQARTDCNGRPLLLLRTVEQCVWGQPAAATATGAAKAKSSRAGAGRKPTNSLLSALCPLPTTQGFTAHKHMCVNSKYEYNNYNNEYNNNNNNELLAWRNATLGAARDKKCAKTYFGVIILFASEVKVIRYTHTLTGTIECVEEEGEEVTAVGCIHEIRAQ